jgi:RNA polymerase sigma-70 factor (ECF subfamily)
VDFFTFDDEYLRRLAAGDRVTEEHFVHYFEKYLLIKLRQRLRSMEAIEDVRQDVFARVFASIRSPGAIREGAKLGPFVNGVCNNVLRERYRSDSRTEQLSETYDVTDPRKLPDDSLATEQTKAIVRAVLEKLSRKDADILRAKFLDERSMEDICREFNVDRGYLRVLLHRAKKHFRSMLNKPGNTPPRRK